MKKKGRERKRKRGVLTPCVLGGQHTPLHPLRYQERLPDPYRNLSPEERRWGVEGRLG